MKLSKTYVKLDLKNIADIEEDIGLALAETAERVRGDVQQAQTMPFDTGALQNRSTFVDDSEIYKGRAIIASDTPYARRLYFHPEYNFNREHNPNAGAAWFEPYITGEKKDFVFDTFATELKRRIE